MKFLERQIEDPVRFAKIKRCFYLSLVLIVLAEAALPLIFGGGHPHFDFESIPAWGSLYGLISCVAIIILSKMIGHMGLMRREDYYDS